jgi:branched-subunit amino acid aminotransferase/4-amino-4-deoxychorismate lyase
VTPDLDRHCVRVNESAVKFFLKPLVTVDAWVGLVADGRKRFDRDAELYIRPMYWAEQGALGAVRQDPESTCWCLCLYETPLPKAAGIAITLSHTVVRRSSARPSMPRQAASIPTMPALCSRPMRAASTIAFCATCSATPQSSARRTYSW